MPTAGHAELDVDAVLAGMAATAGLPGDTVTIATTNVRHLVRFPGVQGNLGRRSLEVDETDHLDMALIIARWQGPPRLPLAQLAVLSPGPRLPDALNGSSGSLSAG